MEFESLRQVRKVEIAKVGDGWRVSWYGTVAGNPPRFSDAYGSFFMQGPDETFETLEAAVSYVEAQHLPE